MRILTFLDAGLPRVHRLREGETIIGRAPDCGLVIAAKEMSRKHARLSVAGSKVILEDLGSTCGTSINGTGISGPHQLNPGDSFTLAAVVITLTNDVNEIDLDDGHVLIDEGRSIVRSMVPVDAPEPAAAANPPAADRRGDRRGGIDRRQRNVGRPPAIADRDATGAAGASSGC